MNNKLSAEKEGRKRGGKKQGEERREGGRKMRPPQ